MNFLILGSVSCLIFVSHFHRSVSGSTFPECESLPQAGFIGGSNGCQSYIYCDGEDSYEGLCPSQLFFNTKDGSCAPADDVDCTDDVGTTTTTTTPSTTTTTTARPTSTTTTKAATTLDAVVTIEKGEEPTEEISIPTESEEIFDIQTSTSVAYTTAVASEGVSTSSPPQGCPANDKLDELILLPSDESCSKYFVCYHGTPVPMYCSGELYFDYITSKCELPERVNCKFGTLTTSNPKKECTRNTFDYFPYAKNCNYFYKCINGFLSLQQCPIGFGWSEEKKLCSKLAEGRCPTRAAEQEQSQVWLNNVFSM